MVGQVSSSASASHEDLARDHVDILWRGGGARCLRLLVGSRCQPHDAHELDHRWQAVPIKGHPRVSLFRALGSVLRLAILRHGR